MEAQRLPPPPAPAEPAPVESATSSSAPALALPGEKSVLGIAPVQETPVDATDVIKLMLQFCKENALLKTMSTLMDETQVTLNTVDSVEQFVADINGGRWDQVLHTVGTLRLPIEKLIDLYEQSATLIASIVLEMIEMREVDMARALLRQTGPMQALKHENSERYLRLEHLASRPAFDPIMVRVRPSGGPPLAVEVGVLPPSRLLALLSQALKWQKHTGQLHDGAYDLLRGAAAMPTVTHETFPTTLACLIRFGARSHPEVAAFSPDGQYLVSGSVDGFVEVWDYQTAQLRKDLQYQAQDQFMVHEDPVLATAFTRDGAILATGAQNGKIKVWRIQTGEVSRRSPPPPGSAIRSSPDPALITVVFLAAVPWGISACGGLSGPTGGVTCMQFSRDGSHLLSGSFDKTIRVHGLKSGKLLKEYKGHQSFVNCLTYTSDGNRIVSGGSDGTVRIWDARTTECLITFKPPVAAGAPTEAAVIGVQLMPRNPDQMVVCTRSPTVFIINTQGQVLRSFSSGKLQGGDFVGSCTSPRGEWLYCLAEDGKMYCFHMGTGKLESILTCHEKEGIGLVHHPHRNLIATYCADGTIKLWRPAD
ncbi:putative Smu-1 suppressor of mec-8 and unc-52 protein [Paratrimastix pyriformis]|uniref:WD40 repeat-containing protein SMU1 n=1 Tax=Paratrimastix pyriformis TaxID=342808 RepID=A0ABQ8UKC7_9EUKA|nr:putative Smu-1 suppressor of mec-8 and unc-52 protein [Paratrimastix pyriformis]